MIRENTAFELPFYTIPNYFLHIFKLHNQASSELLHHRADRPYRLLEIPDHFNWLRNSQVSNEPVLRLAPDPSTGALRLCSNVPEALDADLSRSGLIKIAYKEELQQMITNLGFIVGHREQTGAVEHQKHKFNRQFSISPRFQNETQVERPNSFAQPKEAGADNKVVIIDCSTPPNKALVTKQTQSSIKQSNTF